MPRSTVTMTTNDGRCEASVSRPSSGAGTSPAVLVFMDGIGILPALFAIGERIVEDGYVRRHAASLK